MCDIITPERFRNRDLDQPEPRSKADVQADIIHYMNEIELEARWLERHCLLAGLYGKEGLRAHHRGAIKTQVDTINRRLAKLESLEQELEAYDD